MEQDRYVSDVEAAKLLSASVQTLRNWRHVGRGPAYSKKGKMVRYSIKSLIGFMESGRITPEGGGGGHER
jgi:hypothetical protein